MEVLFLIFWGSSILFSTVVVPIYQQGTSVSNGQLIFDKYAKIIQWEKEYFFQHMVLRQLDIHMLKKEIGLLPHTIYKN